MDRTANLDLPYILPAQAQKHVTHNEAIRALDALIQVSLVSASQTEPPAQPQEGDRHVAGAGATGAWQDRDGMLAHFQDGYWSFHPPQPGWLAFDRETERLILFRETGWAPVSETLLQALAAIQNLPLLGVNAMADAQNRLAIASPGTLFNHEGTGHRLAINKAAAGDTASLLFQQGFSGRAEIGLAGNDDLSVKVSADGAEFRTAIAIDRTSGRVSLPNNGYLESAAFNLLANSGRFAAEQDSVVAGAFVFPSYLTAYPGVSVTGHAKFIHNNTDHGGTAGSLHPDALSLLQKTRGPSYRRYGLEYWIMKVRKDSGTQGCAGGWCNAVYSSARPRPPVLTVSFYAMALVNQVRINRFSSSTIYIDGIERTEADVAIGPAEGWRHVLIHDTVDPYNTYGYSPEPFFIAVTGIGSECLIACLAILPGRTMLPPTIGLIGSSKSY